MKYFAIFFISFLFISCHKDPMTVYIYDDGGLYDVYKYLDVTDVSFDEPNTAKSGFHESGGLPPAIYPAPDASVQKSDSSNLKDMTSPKADSAEVLDSYPNHQLDASGGYEEAYVISDAGGYVVDFDNIKSDGCVGPNCYCPCKGRGNCCGCKCKKKGVCEDTCKPCNKE